MTTGTVSHNQSSGFIVYLIALLAWGAAVAYWSLDLFDGTALSPDSGSPSLDVYAILAAGSLAAAVLAVMIARAAGALPAALLVILASVAYYAAAYFVVDVVEVEDALFWFMYLTPVYCGVFAIILNARYGWGLPQIFYFSLAVSLAHLYAITTAAELYDAQSGGGELQMFTLSGNIAFDNAYLIPGLAGGIIGAALSFLALAPVASGFRNLPMILGASLVLGVMGAVGLSIDLFVLYIPWQIVFGMVILAFMRRR